MSSYVLGFPEIDQTKVMAYGCSGWSLGYCQIKEKGGRRWVTVTAIIEIVK